MWYHYLAILLALYMVGNTIYRTVVYGNHGTYDWVVFGINLVVGLGLGWWAYSGITAPPPSYFPAPTGMTAGRRRRH